jgi:hypothetical protein
MANSNTSTVGNATLTKTTTSFTTAPEALTIIGLDAGDEQSRDYDPRVRAPIDVSLVDNITEFGVLREILVRRDGDQLVVVDGRRRAVHARLANASLKKAGKPEIEVPIRVVTGDELSTLMKARIANSFALKDPVILNAQNASLMLDKGASKKRVALVFGVKEQTIDDWLRLLSLDTDVQKHIAEGWMSVNAGLMLADLSATEQVAALYKAKAASLAEGKTGGKVSTAAVERAVAEKKEEKGVVVKKTPKDRVGRILDIVNALAKREAQGDKLLVADLEKALGQIALAVSDSKFATLVKAQAELMAPADEDESPRKKGKAA